VTPGEWCPVFRFPSEALSFSKESSSSFPSIARLLLWFMLRKRAAIIFEGMSLDRV
jgi:hypothetical protein